MATKPKAMSVAIAASMIVANPHYGLQVAVIDPNNPVQNITFLPLIGWDCGDPDGLPVAVTPLGKIELNQSAEPGVEALYLLHDAGQKKALVMGEWVPLKLLQANLTDAAERLKEKQEKQAEEPDNDSISPSDGEG